MEAESFVIQPSLSWHLLAYPVQCTDVVSFGIFNTSPMASDVNSTIVHYSITHKCKDIIYRNVIE
jgi:hypothetical protein